MLTFRQSRLLFAFYAGLAASFLQGQVVQKPLVTILTRLPGPTAPNDKQQQWTAETVTANLPIPDNWTRGVDSEHLSPLGTAGCGPLFGLTVAVNVTHPRLSDLYISLEAVSADGKTVLKSALLFDGPTLAQSNSAAALSAILSGGFDAKDLLNGGYCGRWRLNVADFAATQTGTLDSWSLKFRTAWYPFVHTPDYYSRLLFGDRSGPDPIHKPVVNDYFREVSRDHFGFTPAGLFGPVDWTTWRNATDNTHVADVIHLLEAQGFNFAAYDHNGNGRIDNEELEILAIDNSTDDAGANRCEADASGHCGPCVALTRSSMQVCAHVALVGEQIDFMTLAHEMSHSLGTVDLYGAWNQECFSNQLTLMSCTEIGADKLQSVYLDPWHRKMLGWVFPYAAGFGPYELGDETRTDFYGGKSRPAVFYRASNPHEYYLFEYRSGQSYDNAVADWGVVAWHVLEDENGNPADNTQGHVIYAFGPAYNTGDQDVGSSRTWKTSDGHFQVKWKDGSYAPLSFWIEQPKYSSNSMILHWDAAPPNNAPPTIRILQPANNSSGPIGFGTNTALQADVKDARGSTAGLRVTWVSDVEGEIGVGLKTGYSFLTPGPRNITVIAIDQYGAIARASVKYTAVATPPIATIFSPGPGQTFYRNQPIVLSGKGSNSVALAFNCNHLAWTADRLPGWSQWGAPNPNPGACPATASFNITGPLTLTLTAYDDSVSPTLTGSASVTINLVDPPSGAPPVVTITAPLDYGLWSSTTYTVSGTVTDPQGGPVTYRWTVAAAGSSAETQISTSPAFNWVPGNVFTTSATIDLRLYGTNNRGQTTVAKKTYFVQQPPR